MKFSRNPISGTLESYSDDCIFAGPVFTMADFINNEQTATDGGPGSGNWGHKGRPGKVGGSGPGGGSQYRGGRSDIGYFSSKKDWLNGLSGEKQQEASKFLKRMESYRDSDYYNRGKFKGEPIEKYIMQASSMGINKERAKLLNYMSEARNWDKNKDRLMKENLTEEERRVFDWIEENFEMGDQGYPNPNNEYGASIANHWINLKSKALGGYTDPDFKIKKEISEASKEHEEDNQNPYPWSMVENDIYTNNLPQNTADELIRILKEYGYDPYVGNPVSDNPKQLSLNWAEKRMIDDDIDQPGFFTKISRYLSAKDKAFGGKYFKILNNCKDGEYAGCLDADSSKRMKEALQLMVDTYKGDKKDATIENFGEEAEKKFLEDKTVDKYTKYYYLYSKALMLGTVSRYTRAPQTTEQALKGMQKKIQADEENAKIKKDWEAFKKNKEDRANAYVRANSAGEVGRIMAGTGMFKPNKATVAIDLMDKTLAVETAGRYEEFVEKFPFMFGRFGTLTCSKDSANNYGKCWLQTRDVNLNSVNYGDYSKLYSMIESDERSGWHPKGCDASSVVVHEMAHALDGYLSEKGINGSSLSSNDTQNFGGILRRSVLRSLKMTKASVEYELSRYAKKDANEWFAECMAEAICSKNPRPMAKECMRQVMEILRREGLIDA